MIQKKEKEYKEQISRLQTENDSLKQMIGEINKRLSKIENA